MFTIRPTGEITLPRGDTLAFRIRMNGASFPEGTVGVLGICNARGTRSVFSKEFPVQGDVITVFLSNRETRALAAGNYAWDMRVVTAPEYNEDGSVRCDDDSDNVISLFSGSGRMPEFAVTGVAVDV